MLRLAVLLTTTCLGSAAMLLLGRALLQQRPTLTPGVSASRLERIWRLDPDPSRRREAALLLTAKASDPNRQRQLLQNQGWGQAPLAAVVLKRSAQLAGRQGQQAKAERLWLQLLQRFPRDPASADALYVLGRGQAELRSRLLAHFPAHPAALAAAVEQGPDGALHLARWGQRWPGAATVMRQRCETNTPPLAVQERDSLAGALAGLGLTDLAKACLGEGKGSPATQLALARNLLHDPAQELMAEAQLLALAQRQPQSQEAVEAVRLLSQGSSPESLAALDALPTSLQALAAVQARRLQAAARTASPEAVLPKALALLDQWRSDPASWELQWQLARQAALADQWSVAQRLLSAPGSEEGRLPVALEARRRFWLGLTQWQLGDQTQARATWRALLIDLPGGYYGWRASSRLGTDPLDLVVGEPTRLRPQRWHALDSGSQELDQLWRLDQTLESWERWRLKQFGKSPSEPRSLLVEARLRRAVGDHWTGLGQLEQANLRLEPRHCSTVQVLERESHAPAFVAELEEASRRSGMPAALLAAVAKQESRFSPAVQSPVGAVGLLQLLPSTAAELTERPVNTDVLKQPGINAELGALYLRQLFTRWPNQPLVAIAGYNAGPGAVAAWVNPQLEGLPEVWVESIPYPETRLYVKKVMGNVWSMQAPRMPMCRQLSAPASGQSPPPSTPPG